MHNTTESVTENIRRPAKEKQVTKERHGIAGHCVKSIAGGSIMVEHVQAEQKPYQNEERKTITTPKTAKERHGVAGHCVKWMAGSRFMVEHVHIVEASWRDKFTSTNFGGARIIPK